MIRVYCIETVRLAGILIFVSAVGLLLVGLGT